MGQTGKNKTNLEVINKLDVSVNKDDLMDILVDKKLTALESEVSSIRDEIKAISKEINESLKELVALKLQDMLGTLMKLIPKDSLVGEMNKVSYSSIYNNTSYSTKLTFKMSDGVNLAVDISLSLSNISKVQYDFAYDFEKASSKIRQLNSKLVTVQEEIELINKSGKRVRARMLSNILKESRDGKAILDLINNKDLKLLDFKTTV